MNRLNIQQGQNIEIVDNNTIAKLYDTAISVSEPEQGEQDLAYLSGNLLTNKSYRTLVEYLTNRFLDLYITANDYYIPFEDLEVLNVLLANNIGDGMGVTETEASTTTITNSMFLGNTDITKFNEFEYFKNTLISNNSFKNCSSLTSIKIPNSVTLIGENAFYICSKLSSIVIPDSVKRIESNAFQGCSSLQKVIVPNIAAWCNIAFASEKSNPLTLAHHLYSDENTEVTNLVIPDGVTLIKLFAFKNCTSITSVTIPDSVTAVYQYAFAYSIITTIDIHNVTYLQDHAFLYCKDLTSVTLGNISFLAMGLFEGCSSLTSITIPSGVKIIGQSAFDSCSALVSVNIPDSVTSIGIFAFSQCSSLTSINIPSGVESIGDWTFFGCSSLTSINIPDSVTSIGGTAFRGCSKLTSITIPNSVTSIGGMAFNDCTKLTSITLSENLTKIGDGTFRNCSKLTSITIPTTVTTIGGSAFALCTSLAEIKILATTPPALGSYAFAGVPSKTLIQVPAASVEAYKAATGEWSVYASKIVAIQS